MALPAKPLAQRPTSSFWREKTDDELLETEFIISQPELLEGMSDCLPTPGEVVIEFAYDLRGRPAGRARCVHCKFPNHFRGFVIKLADGSRRLVGKDCGSKLYGAEFKLLEKDFDNAQELASWLRRRQHLLAAAPLLQEGIERLLADDSFSTFSWLRHRLWAVFEPGFRMTGLAQSLKGVALRGDQLIISERVRDYAAEEARHLDDGPEHAEKLKGMNRVEQKRYRRRHNLPNPEIYKVLNKPIGTLRGGALFLGGTLPGVRCEEIGRDISNVIGVLKSGSNWSINRLGGACKHLVDLVDLLEVEIAKLRAPLDFFELSHLQTIVRWAKHYEPDTGYRCDAGRIERVTESGIAVRAECPANYAPPYGQFITSFRDAVA